MENLRLLWEEKLAPFKIEISLITIAAVVSIVSGFLLYSSINIPEKAPSPEPVVNISSADKKEPSTPSKIAVEVSGAVVDPDVYIVSPGTRLRDVIKQAGGITTEADSAFYGRNFNLSRMVTEQEKIYVPFRTETANGIFLEKSRYLEYLTPQTSGEPQNSTIAQSPTASGKSISLNNATSEELDTLPGIGKTVAEKIISNRPYSSTQELLDKKIVSASVFSQVSDSIVP